MWTHAALCCLLVLQLATFASGRRLLSAAAAGLPPPRLATLPAAFLPLEEVAIDESAKGTVQMKIIDGEAAPAEQFGFMVALLHNKRFFCGGTLLDATSVLTAAHCVVDTGLVDDFSGLTVWRIDGTQYEVEQVLAHPGYSAQTIPQDNIDMTFEGELHDLAVLKLKTAVPEPVTVELANSTASLSDGQQLQVSGWGTTETGQASSILKYAIVDLLSDHQCPADYTDVLCAGGTGENTCNGDSGGPLILRDAATGDAAQLGITSHGPDCLSGPNFAYGYYTDVRQYLDVIASFRNGTQIAWPPSSDSNKSGNLASSPSLQPSVSTQSDSSLTDGIGFIQGTDPNGAIQQGVSGLDEILCDVLGCPPPS